jgi:ankyrin repeat protein
VDRQGMSLLHLAAMFGHAGIATVLLKAGASRETKNRDGETPAMMASVTMAAQINAFEA